MGNPITTMLPSESNKPQQRKLRQACDVCHSAKMKCSGGKPCAGCRDSGYECLYSVSNRIGRPKGTKNKRTLERMSRQQSDTDSRMSTAERHGSQGLQTTAGPGQLSTAFGSGFDQDSTIDTTSLDTLMGNTSDIDFSLRESFPSFSDPLDSWCGLEDLDPNSPLKVRQRCFP